MSLLHQPILPNSVPGRHDVPNVDALAGNAESAVAAHRSLRVLHVIDSGGLYGAEQVLLELATEHRRLGHTSLIASIRLPRETEKPLERAARERDLAVAFVPMAAGPSVLGAFHLVRLAREWRADIIQTHGYKANILLGLTPKWLRPAPLVATVHGYTDLGGVHRMSLYHRVDRLVLRRADRVVLVHRGMATTRGLNRLHDARWRVIENGIPRAALASSLPDPSWLPDEDVVQFCGRGRVVIGAIGRLSHEKAFDVMLRAVAAIVRDRDDVVAVILGEGRQRQTLERLVQDLGLHGRVLMPGYRSNARNYLRLFDLFVLPSLTEGLPIVLLEAMQAGIPVVATKVGGVPSVLDEGRGGFLVEAGDWRALASAMRRGIADRSLASQLAAHSLATQSSRFSSQAMATRYLELYHEVASRG
ncbi:MAG: glycosyltransferase [Luteitalea sp.]|nr:glycosyltransferase [Luteitalea sp.]